MTMLDKTALEAAAKALRPDLFSDVEQVRHQAASPMSVNVMQERYRQQAETSVAAYLDALSSIPEQGGDDFTERLREAAYRDTAKSITVSAADLRAHLEATQRYVLAKLAPSRPAAVVVTDEMVEHARGVVDHARAEIRMFEKPSLATCQALISAIAALVDRDRVK